MPPKAINPAITPLKSSSLIPFGPRAVAGRRKNQSVRDENGEKPTTARAMVLRNGKHGARGTGEMILVSKLSGREKLDLLAEDIVEQSKTAIMAPFRLEECLKIADSQCHAFLDDITNLRDPQFFMYIIQAELNARTRKDKTKSEALKNASYVASAVATRIHNAYMLASAWKLVSQILGQLAFDGVTDASIKSQLGNNAQIRARYMVLYDLVSELVEMTQSKFSVLATTTPHYARYFKVAPDQADVQEPEMMFDWQELREACLSFLDSIIIELCFPRPPYPKNVLYQILGDAVAESPKEAKRFPQELWDAVGDLSISIQLQQLLEAPLAGPDSDAWKAEPREMPTEYERWAFAQIHSRVASDKYANFKDLIFPLEKTKTKIVLDSMWEYINLNYKAVSGEDINMLWGLTAEFQSTPQWHAVHMSSSRNSDSKHDRKPLKFKGKNFSERLAITSGPADDSDDSMPDLQSVSDSSDELDSDSDEESDGEDEESDTDESGYDTEEEDELREMLREAMDTAHEADWLHSAQISPAAEIDPFEQNDRKSNPFLKLLSSLRGRLFSSSPKLKSTTRTQTTGSKVTRAPGMSPGAPVTISPKTTPLEPQIYMVTAEDVEDENVVTQVKKKKKKPKKKKKTMTPADAHEEDEGDGLTSPTITPASSAPSPAKPAFNSTTVPLIAKKIAPKVFKAQASTFIGSTSSLPLPTETVAQSARSYLAENMNTQKAKVKSRPSHATVFAASEKKFGFFSRIISRVKGEPEEKPQKGAKHSWFTQLTKKSKGLMHQLLNTADDEMKGIAPMKWEHFLKLMREMGFEYDPSTAGSSVRFDPPDPRDPPITFHRPHPDPTLQPVKLKIYAKRLKDRYGWTEEDFIRQTEV